MDKIWFDRHLSLRYRIEAGVETVDSEIWKGALQSAQRVIEKYGEENLGPYSDFEWGMLNGKLSALRWVLGDEWDIDVVICVGWKWHKSHPNGYQNV